MRSVAGRNHRTARQRKTWSGEINIFLGSIECLDVGAFSVRLRRPAAHAGRPPCNQYRPDRVKQVGDVFNIALKCLDLHSFCCAWMCIAP